MDKSVLENQRRELRGFQPRTLPEVLAQTARRHPRRTALIYAGTVLTYRTLLEHVQRCAAGLQKLGVRPGDRVALMMQNCPQFVLAYFGALQAGAIVTPTSPIYTPREAGHQWHDAGASVVIADVTLLPVVDKARVACPDLTCVVTTDSDEYRSRRLTKLTRSWARGQRSKGGPVLAGHGFVPWGELLGAGRRPKPVKTRVEDLACLQYTGGTTGTSKGAMLTHANLVTNAEQANRWAGGQRKPDTAMAVLPLFHIFAQTCVMICTIARHGTIVILPRFELESALAAVRRYRPTLFHGVPTMFLALSNAPNPRRAGLHSLRFCLSGGAALPMEVAQRFETVTGARLVEGYGLTEASPVTHVNPVDGTARKGSIGKPVAATQVRIMDIATGTREMPVGEPGEIAIRGPQVMKGYWQKPDESARVLRGGWLYTGDIAKRDTDGFYYIVDRKKDLIIAGGFNIYPREVEEVLFEHPKVKEAVVVGVPDPYRGETVQAFVVLHDGAETSVDEINSFCRERLASYKVPRLIEFRASLPKSGVGKYLRRELRAEALAAQAAAAGRPLPPPPTSCEAFDQEPSVALKPKKGSEPT
jgi:long-chain acyl-CoA synthetase